MITPGTPHYNKPPTKLTRAELLAENTRLRTQINSLEQQAGIDTLTGIANRVGVIKAISGLVVPREFRRGTDQSLPQGATHHYFALLDLDRFKGVNDTHGHQVGDEALRATAHILTDTLRVRDVVARIGGDEFAVVLPNTQLEDAKKALDRSRQFIDGIQSITLPSDMTRYRVDISTSIGVVDVSPDNPDFETVYPLADQAMYEAKKKGGNQIIVAKLT